MKGTPNLTGAGGQMAFNDSYPRFEMEPVVGAPETILKPSVFFSNSCNAIAEIQKKKIIALFFSERSKYVHSGRLGMMGRRIVDLVIQ